MEQMIPGGFRSPVDDTTTEYNSVIGGSTWDNAELDRYEIVSTDGVIKNLRVVLSAAPGAGTHFDFTLMLNGNPTALTFEIADAATSGNNMVNEIDVTGGDTISIQCDPDNTPSTPYAYWTTVFEGENASESLILGASDDGAATGSTDYAHALGPNEAMSGVENDHREVMPTGGKIKNLYVKLSEDPGTAPDAYRFTVRLNKTTDADSPIVTIVANATTGSDLVNELDVVAGDVITLMIEPLNSPSQNPKPAWGMTFVATIDGESIVMGGLSIDLDPGDTEYANVTMSQSLGWTPTENQRYNLGQVCTVSKLHVLLSAAPGVGNDRDFAIRIAGTNVVTLQISDAATTGDSGGLSDTVANDEYMGIRTIPTGGPDLADAYWGFVGYIEPPPVPPVEEGGLRMILSLKGHMGYDLKTRGGKARRRMW